MQGACVLNRAVQGCGRRLNQSHFWPMAEVSFLPSTNTRKRASASREQAPNLQLVMWLLNPVTHNYLLNIFHFPSFRRYQSKQVTGYERKPPLLKQINIKLLKIQCTLIFRWKNMKLIFQYQTNRIRLSPVFVFKFPGRRHLGFHDV